MGGFSSGTRGRGAERFFVARIGLCYLAFIAGDLCFFLFAALSLPLRLVSPRTWRRCVSFVLRNALKFCVFAVFPALGAYRVREIRGLDEVFETAKGNPRKNLIFAANHTSWLDPLFMLALVPDAVAVLKKKYAKLPSIRFLTAFFGFAALDGTADSARKALGGLEESLRGGMNVVIFPEGRRGSPNRLGGFGKLAFKLAKSAGADVVPVAILSSEPFLSEGARLLPPSGNEFSVRFLPVLEQGKFGNPSEILEAARAAVGAVVRSPDSNC